MNTEFIDRGVTLEPISIGLVAEDSREYYAISTEFNPDAANEMVRSEVLPRLEPRESGLWKPLSAIARDLTNFVDAEPEFWTWGGGAFDWFVVVTIFGGTDHFPVGWPYVINDLDQWMLMLGLKDTDAILPPHPGNPHHALADAYHNKLAYDTLVAYQQEWIRAQVAVSDRYQAKSDEGRSK